MTREEVALFLDREFPQVRNGENLFHLEQVRRGLVTMHLEAGESHLRPGGMVSGPSLFALADVAAYVAILAHIGPVAAVVTTNMSINFLRKAVLGPLRAEARLLKLGGRSAVVEIAIFSDKDEPCAHAVGTYAVPGKQTRVS